MGDITIIYLMLKSGGAIQCLIETSDLVKISSIRGLWRPLWCKNSGYYKARGSIKGKEVYMHRFVMDAPDDLLVDHINHNTLDNRRDNLRLATYSENGQNRKGASSRSKSLVRGVYWNKREFKWIAQIRLNGKVYGGRYDSKKEAIKASSELRKELMPFSKEARNKK